MGQFNCLGLQEPRQSHSYFVIRYWSSSALSMISQYLPIINGLWTLSIWNCEKINIEGLGNILNWIEEGTVGMRRTNLISELLSQHRTESGNPTSRLVCWSWDPPMNSNVELQPDNFTHKRFARSLLYLPVKTRLHITVATSILGGHVKTQYKCL